APTRMSSRRSIAVERSRPEEIVDVVRRSVDALAVGDVIPSVSEGSGGTGARRLLASSAAHSASFLAPARNDSGLPRILCRSEGLECPTRTTSLAQTKRIPRRLRAAE